MAESRFVKLDEPVPAAERANDPLEERTLSTSILLDGKIVGVWKRRGKAVELTWLMPLQSLQRKRIEEEALRIFGDSISKPVWRD